MLIAALLSTACADDGGAAVDGDDEAVVRSAEALICLSDQERPRVAAAAVLHGLARPGPTSGQLRDGGRVQTVPQWRQSEPEKFAAACRVVVTANGLSRGAASGNDGNPLWTVVWPLLIGAALTLVTTFLTTGWRERMTEARRHSAVLRTATSDYVSAVDAFLDVATDRYQSEPTGDELDEPRRRLQRALDETPRPDRIPAVARAGLLLGTGVLGRDLATGWSAASARDPDGDRTRRVGAALVELRAATDAIAAERERPIRSAAARVRRSVGPLLSAGWRRARRRTAAPTVGTRGEESDRPPGRAS